MDQRLAARPEAGADQHAVGAQHQRGCEPASVGDAARRQQQRVGALAGQQIGDLRHEGEGRAAVAVAAGLAALRDDDRRASIERLANMIERLALADQRDLRRRDLGRKGAGSPKESISAAGRCASAAVSRCGCFASDQVMKPQPVRVLPAWANSRSSQSPSP